MSKPQAFWKCVRVSPRVAALAFILATKASSSPATCSTAARQASFAERINMACRRPRNGTNWPGFRWSLIRWAAAARRRSEEHTSELQSRLHLVCRLLLEKKKKKKINNRKCEYEYI